MESPKFIPFSVHIPKYPGEVETREMPVKETSIFSDSDLMNGIDGVERYLNPLGNSKSREGAFNAVAEGCFTGRFNELFTYISSTTYGTIERRQDLKRKVEALIAPPEDTKAYFLFERHSDYSPEDYPLIYKSSANNMSAVFSRDHTNVLFVEAADGGEELQAYFDVFVKKGLKLTESFELARLAISVDENMRIKILNTPNVMLEKAAGKVSEDIKRGSAKNSNSLYAHARFEAADLFRMAGYKVEVVFEQSILPPEDKAALVLLDSETAESADMYKDAYRKYLSNIQRRNKMFAGRFLKFMASNKSGGLRCLTYFGTMHYQIPSLLPEPWSLNTKSLVQETTEPYEALGLKHIGGSEPTTEEWEVIGSYFKLHNKDQAS